MLRRQLVELEVESLIRPVCDEAEESAGQVQHRDGSSEHHNDPDHGDYLRETVIILNDLALVNFLVISLKNLSRLLLVP